MFLGVCFSLEKNEVITGKQLKPQTAIVGRGIGLWPAVDEQSCALVLLFQQCAVRSSRKLLWIYPGSFF